MKLSVKSRGFTIVELLIVIVVIGVIASIVVVAYAGITTRALNASRFEEMKSWVRVLQSYQAVNGHLPKIEDGYHYYCLGSGFPIGNGGVPRCRDYNDAGSGLYDNNISYPESENAGFMAELGTVGKVSAAPKKPINGTVGPYVHYDSTWGATVVQWFNGGPSDCPSGTTREWDDGAGRLGCSMSITN
jgi:prepilin-type N-terminal cleavage/methylation domain-containing protein